MNPMPLHPALVHVPLGLAVLLPLLTAGVAWAVWTGRLPIRAWLAVVATGQAGGTLVYVHGAASAYTGTGK